MYMYIYTYIHTYIHAGDNVSRKALTQIAAKGGVTSTKRIAITPTHMGFAKPL